MDQPLVSVVIPVWNGEKSLPRCLRSVQAQSWKALEIIVVDDGSTDGTAALLDATAALDNRIRVLHQANAGVSAARNNALPLCRGKYIRFVDSDDELPTDSIEQLVTRAEQNGSDLVLAAYTNVIGLLRKVCALEKRDETLDCNAFLDNLNRKANSFYYGVLWNKLFRTATIQENNIRFESGLSYGEDMVFVCEYLKHVQKVTYATVPVYDYIRNPKGMTAHQALDSVKHPVRNIGVKIRIYQALKDLYMQRNLYVQYKRTLWLYLVRITLDE